MAGEKDSSQSPAMSLQETRDALTKEIKALDADTIALYRQQAAQYSERLSWAPAVGNGTAIVALAGVIGNVPSPDTALSALTWPLAVFTLGAALGLASIFLTRWVLDVVTDVQDAANKNRAETLKLLDESVEMVRQLTPENLQESASAIDKRRGKGQELLEQSRALERKTRRASLANRFALWFNVIAIITVALGMSILLVGHASGMLRLEAQPLPEFRLEDF